MKIKLYILNWAILVLSTLTILLLMHPFLKYPFDMYHHLLWINDYYTHNNTPNDLRFLWHYEWSRVFKILELDNTKLFDRAYIIHYTQIIISYFSVYYFSYTIFKYTLPKTYKLNWHTMAAWASLVWFTIYATESVGFHLVWIQWYSINYQVSLPLTLLATAFLLNFFSNTNKTKYIYLLFLILTTSIVLIIHSAEFVYFIMYLSLLFLIYIDKILKFLKRNKIITTLLFLAIIIFIYNLDSIISLISYRTPKLLLFIINGNFSGLWHFIIKEGDFIIHFLSRARGSFNELMIVSLYLLIPIIFISLYLKNKCNINIRLIIFLIFSSLFVLIPMYQITAGIASAITYKLIVNRFYYSSTIFLIIPLFSYLILLIIKKDKNIVLLSIITAIILLATFIYSRYAIGTQQNYYKNIQSIKNAWHERKVGFNLSKQQIKDIGKQIKEYKTKYGNNIIFFAREDIGFILKNIYNQKVYLPTKWRGHKLNKDFYIKAYYIKETNATKVLFNIPKKFPNYEPYK